MPEPEQALDLVQSVRSALTHLYDPAYLANHPLALMVDADHNLDRMSRAQRLRRLLLDLLEEIRPQEIGLASERDRVYAILTYRYVDGLTMDQVAAKRGLSERQAYRALERGIQAIASLLQDRLRQLGHSVPMANVSEQPAGDQIQLALAEVARLRKGVQVESLDPKEVLDGVLAMLSPMTSRPATRITVATPGPWPSVTAYRVMLRQAFLNLLSYLLDRVPQGEIIIRASADRGTLAIVVSLSAEVGDAATPSDAGLAVARALLEAQEGRLLQSEEEGRLLMQILLPIATHGTLLVIDDNPDLVALLQRYLASHAVTVVAATQAEQALRLAQELRPRLITLDVMMPDQDGWEILQQLKRLPQTADIPVVVCSVLREQRLAEAMGASGYITKPVRQEDLLTTLGRWLGPLQPGV